MTDYIDTSSDTYEALRLYESADSVKLTWARRSSLRLVETEVVRLALRDYLPPPPCHVIDVGCGNGFWSLYLQDLGYLVSGVDQSRPLISDAVARSKGLTGVEFSFADARNLSNFSDNAFQFALAFGPMYGLLNQTDRIQAMSEVARVVEPGRTVLVEILQPLAALRDLMCRAPDVVASIDTSELLNNGRLTSQKVPEFLRLNRYLQPAQAAEELQIAGLTAHSVIRLDGPDPVLGQESASRTDRASILEWARISYRIGQMDEYHSSSSHLLIPSSVV
ncbi:class I SAM-dependent methyltransferase [Pseudonocardia sp. EV170527-09]|uniref:class I SAM-dependent methyltransferase n=1 Tax=Pseudonocardia sp. EV170527-09 TaxID=2603411 RepID=UPI0011F1403F|nr:class I SAM-dependent methyltransferase [Pseudonocardia sp. EV170527-09]